MVFLYPYKTLMGQILVFSLLPPPPTLPFLLNPQFARSDVAISCQSSDKTMGVTMEIQHVVCYPWRVSGHEFSVPQSLTVEPRYSDLHWYVSVFRNPHPEPNSPRPPTGLMSDTLVYSIIIPIIPFKLEQMGYRKVSGRVGWLLFAYVCYSLSAVGIPLI